MARNADRSTSTIRDVLIVGGGSAGWMTAAYLRRALASDVRIRLVESPRVPTIGVGEATFSTLKLMFDFLGLAEREWMPACNATYKLAIRFENWRATPGHFYHPFERFRSVDGRTLGEWWYRLGGRSGATATPFDYASFCCPALCDSGRGPRLPEEIPFDERFADRDGMNPGLRLDRNEFQNYYGYHFDAGLLADYLRRYAVDRGVRWLRDDVVDVHYQESGAIAAVQGDSSGPLAADLFVDCTGFRGLLINKALKEPFISYQRHLPCDRALAAQLPHADGQGRIAPYTTATARDAGWVWRIPLQARLGSGYVYASEFLRTDDAQVEFARELGVSPDRFEPSRIHMRVGRTRRSWVYNCVAIGLSGGFVEPLESTGLFFTQLAIEHLARELTEPTFDRETGAGRFNRKIADCMDGVRDFLVLHYVVSDRHDTPFWQSVGKLELPPSLAERMALWEHEFPTPETVNPAYHGFHADSYVVMLLGLGWRPRLADNPHPGREVQELFAQVRKRSQWLVDHLPTHHEYLAGMRRGSLPRRRAAMTDSGAA